MVLPAQGDCTKLTFRRVDIDFKMAPANSLFRESLANMA